MFFWLCTSQMAANASVMALSSLRFTSSSSHLCNGKQWNTSHAQHYMHFSRMNWTSQAGTTASMADTARLWQQRTLQDGSNNSLNACLSLDYVATWSFEDSAPTQRNWQWHHRHWCRCPVAPLSPCLLGFCHPAIQMCILKCGIRLSMLTVLLFH